MFTFLWNQYLERAVRGHKRSASEIERICNKFLLPRLGDQPMTGGTIEEQTRNVCEQIKATLAEAGCELADVVKAMVWLREREDFPGFNAAFGEYFPIEPPARSAVLNQLLLDVRVEVEVIAYRPQ